MKFAPKRKLKRLLRIKKSFFDGSSHSEQFTEFILYKQSWFNKLLVTKLIELKVKAQRQIFVMDVNGCQSLYSFNSLLISIQNQTEIVIKVIAKLVIKSPKLSLPINKIKLIKNNMDILEN